jgi:hypothetical protein
VNDDETKTTFIVGNSAGFSRGRASESFEEASHPTSSRKDETNMSDRYEPKAPNTQLYFLFKKFKDWSPIVAVVISCHRLQGRFKTMGDCSDLSEPANQYPIKNPN